MEPASEDVNIVDSITKNSDCYINLVDKPAAGLERIDFNFARSTVGNIIVSTPFINALLFPHLYVLLGKLFLLI